MNNPRIKKIRKHYWCGIQAHCFSWPLKKETHLLSCSENSRMVAGINARIITERYDLQSCFLPARITLFAVWRNLTSKMPVFWNVTFLCFRPSMRSYNVRESSFDDVITKSPESEKDSPLIVSLLSLNVRAWMFLKPSSVIGRTGRVLSIMIIFGELKHRTFMNFWEKEGRNLTHLSLYTAMPSFSVNSKMFFLKPCYENGL